jgi:CheY-specific phosphatase CheX
VTELAATSAGALDGALVEIVQDIFSVMCAFPMFEEAPTGPILTGHASLVGIVGESSHTVRLAFTPDLGDRIAAGLFEMAVEDLDDDSRADALGELANIVAGGIKAVLAESSQLSLPTVVLNAPVPVIVHAVATNSTTFTDGTGSMTITVWKQTGTTTMTSQDGREPA